LARGAEDNDIYEDSHSINRNWKPDIFWIWSKDYSPQTLQN